MDQEYTITIISVIILLDRQVYIMCILLYMHLIFFRSVWIMGLVGVGGNFFVIVSRLMIREKNRAHSFYIKNLAVADLLMGAFLISIAFHDLTFRGHFLAHQHSWRHSITCQLSGKERIEHIKFIMIPPQFSPIRQ